jgi:hypothetical protein
LLLQTPKKPIGGSFSHQEAVAAVAAVAAAVVAALGEMVTGGMTTSTRAGKVSSSWESTYSNGR